MESSSIIQVVYMRDKDKHTSPATRFVFPKSWTPCQ